MTEQTPEQQMMERINSLNSDLQSLQSDVRLSSVRDSLEDIDTLVNGLGPCIQDLRKQGYVFGKGFEGKSAAYVKQWGDMRASILQEINRQSPMLEQQIRPLEDQLAQVRARATNPAIVKPAVDRLENEIESLKSKVNAAESSINGMFDSLQSETNAFNETLDRINEMLQHFSAACFRLLPTEGAVMAVKATYSRDPKTDKDDPQGFLFLTDQRLLFEQNQEIATKKVLFITTEKQKVQKLLLEVPLALLDQALASKQGLFGHEDHLELRLKSGAQAPQAWFHLDGQDCNLWQATIGQACSGGLANDRAVAIDAEEERKAHAAPSQCPNCGAPITQVVLRGMDSITCAYCQHVIRL